MLMLLNRHATQVATAPSSLEMVRVEWLEFHLVPNRRGRRAPAVEVRAGSVALECEVVNEEVMFSQGGVERRDEPRLTHTLAIKSRI